MNIGLRCRLLVNLHCWIPHVEIYIYYKNMFHDGWHTKVQSGPVIFDTGRVLREVWEISQAQEYAEFTAILLQTLWKWEIFLSQYLFLNRTLCLTFPEHLDVEETPYQQKPLPKLSVLLTWSVFTSVIIQTFLVSKYLSNLLPSTSPKMSLFRMRNFGRSSGRKPTLLWISHTSSTLTRHSFL